MDESVNGRRGGRNDGWMEHKQTDRLMDGRRKGEERGRIYACMHG